MRKALLCTVAAAMALVGTAASAAGNLVSNGGFGTGDFTSWTVAATANGSVGDSPDPQVTLFDVTGAGAQNAAEFQVGHTSGGIFSSPGGADLSQSITTVAGTLSLSMDFAALGNPDFGNAEGGFFAILLDGTSVGSANLNPIGVGQTLRGSLDVDTTVTAGSHLLTIEITRQFFNGNTPHEYVTDISAVQSGGAVPEPAAWALMIAGFGLVGAASRRRRTAVGAA